MARSWETLSLQSLPFILLASILLLSQPGLCYPIHSLNALSTTSAAAGVHQSSSRYGTPTDGIQRRAEGGITPFPRSSSYMPHLWSEKNKLAVGLGVGLGGFFLFSGMLLLLCYQKNWHHMLFRSSRVIQCNDISRPIFNPPAYSSPGARTAHSNVRSRTDPEEGRVSHQSITTPPPIYTSLPDFPSPLEAYYQPVEIYRAVIASSSNPQSQPSPPAASSVPLHIPPPPPRLFFPPPPPGVLPHGFSSPPPRPPPPPPVPAAPVLPAISPISSCCSASASTTCSSQPCSPTIPSSPPAQHQDSSEQRIASIYSPCPLPGHVAQFLQPPLRSNSVDTDASACTIIQQDAMSERSVSVSPKTIPGAAIRVDRVPELPRNPLEGVPVGLGIRFSNFPDGPRLNRPAST